MKTIARIGVLSFSDGRRRVHEGLAPVIARHERALAEALRRLGAEAIEGGEAAWSPRRAVAAARRLAAADPAAVVFNLPVFAFPSFAVLAADILRRPLALWSPGEPGLPGMGGLLAAGGALEQAGHDHERIWGPLRSAGVRARLDAFARAAGARHALRGQVYGQIGGRSIGMITGVGSSVADWHRTFGVDIDHADQSEILRRAEAVPARERERVAAWLERHAGAVAYAPGSKLTRESLRRQAAWAVAVKRIVEEREFDFVGIQCHYDLSEYYGTQCLSAAFLPSRLDWDGPREPVACACEADGDGALTMQILQLLSGQPALFMDLRHYEAARRLWTLCNCGGLSLHYARRARDPAANVKAASLVPVIPKYGGVGAHVRYVAAPGPLTCARLMRDRRGWRLLAFRARAVAAKASWPRASCPSWPHLYARIDAEPRELLDALHANHVHAVAGNSLPALAAFARLTGVPFEQL